MRPDLVGFTLIIDDIVRPDGTTYMQQLGGGGECWWVECIRQRGVGGWVQGGGLFRTVMPHRPQSFTVNCWIVLTGPQTMFGFQLVSQCLGHPPRPLGLAAGVGSNLPDACKVLTLP